MMLSCGRGGGGQSFLSSGFMLCRSLPQNESNENRRVVPNVRLDPACKGLLGQLPRVLYLDVAAPPGPALSRGRTSDARGARNRPTIDSTRSGVWPFREPCRRARSRSNRRSRLPQPSPKGREPTLQSLAPRPLCLPRKKVETNRWRPTAGGANTDWRTHQNRDSEPPPPPFSARRCWLGLPSSSRLIIKQKLRVMTK